jgi:hypothetical protein
MIKFRQKIFFAPLAALGGGSAIMGAFNVGSTAIGVGGMVQAHNQGKQQEEMNDQNLKMQERQAKQMEEQMKAQNKALQAIAVPKYNLSNKAIEPPLVAVRLGREVFIKGIVDGGVRVTYKKPILVDEKYAIVGISFTVSEVDPYDASTVFQNGSFRGLTATLRKGMNF